MANEKNVYKEVWDVLSKVDVSEGGLDLPELGVGIWHAYETLPRS